MGTAAALFVLTYALISAPRLGRLRLDRPAVAFVGAVLMVLFTPLTLEEAFRAINLETLALLFGFMLLVGLLAKARFFEIASWWILAGAHTPARLLIGVSLGAAALSALFVNDTVCLVLTPILLGAARRARLDPFPYLMALAAAANTGSVATITGNPQNMLIGIRSGWSFGGFLLWLLPVALVALAAQIALLLWLFRRDLPRRRFDALGPPPRFHRRLTVRLLVVAAGMFAGFVIFRDLPLVALAGGAAALVAARRPPAEAFRRVDWPLLVFFAGLFVVVHGVERAGLLALAFERVEPLLLGGTPAGRLTALSALSVLFSNVFSNVPFVMVAGPLVERLPEARLGWLVLAMSSTLAGNLTIVGSVANMIVLEQARDAVHVGFGRFFRIGLPVTLLTTLIGTAMLIACLRWLG